MQAHKLWLHIDAAYGGAYACLPDMQPQFEGIDACILTAVEM